MITRLQCASCLTASLLLGSAVTAYAQANMWKLSIGFVSGPTFSASTPATGAAGLGFVKYHNWGGNKALLSVNLVAATGGNSTTNAYARANYFYSVYPVWDGNVNARTPFTYYRQDMYATGVAVYNYPMDVTSGLASSLTAHGSPQWGVMSPVSWGNYTVSTPGPTPDQGYATGYIDASTWPYGNDPDLGTVSSMRAVARGGFKTYSNGAEGGVGYMQYSMAVTQEYMDTIYVHGILPLSYGGRYPGSGGYAADVNAGGAEEAVAGLVLDEYHEIF